VISGSDRTVFDCNVYLQALLNGHGPAGKCLSAALEGKFVLLWTPVIVAELRSAALSAGVQAKYPHVTVQRLDLLIANVQKVAQWVHQVPAVFEYERDPDDAHYINVAIAAGARLVVSRDKDLLSLMDAAGPAGRDFRARFPNISILTPPQFLQELEAS
jgi:putative PIN family toxin of toxin-antitoxin system